MTEAGRKWIERCKFGEDGVGYVEDYSFLEKMEQEAEFWLRAFCDEVEQLSEDPKYVHESGRRGLAFDELKRKFLED